MIKVDKDPANIPASLCTPSIQNKRQDVMDKGQYLKRYDAAYKGKDTKQALRDLYHGKCCYCEQDISDNQPHVEHYRPKSIYYWLAFSWDNLMLCCASCNTYKKDHFDINGIKEHPTLTNIHGLAADYHKSELPMMIHPELEDISGTLRFDEMGKIFSSDTRARYTIDTCRIDRYTANYRRKKMLDSFIKKYNKKLLLFKKGKISVGILMDVLHDFKCEALDDMNEYLAFRRYIIAHFKDFL